MDIITIILDDNAVLCSTSEQTARQNICNTCDKNTNNFCNECGCVLEVRTGYKLLDCPLGKWNGISL
jgi:membrane protease subunit (stomatin/prohibitin family)